MTLFETQVLEDGKYLFFWEEINSVPVLSVCFCAGFFSLQLQVS